MSLSQNIKNIRLEKGLTQEQLATKLGVSAQAVSKWETSETYPDGAILTALADTLDTSLDVLFDHASSSIKEISSKIIKLLFKTDNEDIFNTARDICWQIEKGLFNCCSLCETEYNPNDYLHYKDSSYILKDYGFTEVSNGQAPFFAVFPDDGKGFSEVIGDGEEMRKIFEVLSNPETMRAVLFIHKNEENYAFEKEVLAKACEIEEPQIDNVMKNLLFLKVVYKVELELNGELRTLYYAQPSHKIIALFLFAHEIMYRGSYCYQTHNRTRPFLK